MSGRIDCLVKVYEELEENANKLRADLSNSLKENETLKINQVIFRIFKNKRSNTNNHVLCNNVFNYKTEN